ncbi:hypothetical protein [Lihuaxuella thermophila]|uniref:Uncharacterized protein n=1 Tax=Lihuaxuella thermophila TaxID=1173111 RepID=A0A1H8J148_9BACL|nr:hypothetical protein [Lihuaxuella thermophila]SEN74700.1 hypothetical protein SAMN05444955_1214 [Lihuaxuella thermophila]
MEQREIVLKLDIESKQMVCRLLNKHLEELLKKAEVQHTFAQLLIAHEVDRTNYILDQLNSQWTKVLPFTLSNQQESGGLTQ